MANTRDTLYRRRLKIINNPAAREGAENTPQEGAYNAPGENQGAALEGGAAWSMDIDNRQADIPPGPARQIIKRMPTKWERRLKRAARIIDKTILLSSRLVFTVWELRPWREKTAQELALQEELKERAKERRKLRKEGNLFARRASRAYARMGICYTPPYYQRSLINPVKQVRFTDIVAEPNAIYLKIDTARLPPGVSILKCIQDEDVITNLSASLGHHVTGSYKVDKGAWLTIERGSGTRGIPNHVTYKHMMELREAKSHRLTVPIGQTSNSKRIYRSLRDFTHILTAGSTGMGKTSWLNVLLAAMIENNTPDDLKIVLVDLKGGIEFEIYRGIPHLWELGGIKDKEGQPLPEDELIAPGGIVGRAKHVNNLLEFLVAEGERRLKFFKKAGVTNIDEYNKRRIKTRLPRILLVFDEWARVALSPDGNQADILLSEITATYRAVGFHVVLATQNPNTKVISSLITTNFNARLAFGVPTLAASLTILQSGKAKGLSPPGRAIFQFGSQVVECQVPYIKKNELKAILAEARQDGGAVENDVTTNEIIKYSLNHLEGSLAVNRIYQQFREKIGRNAIHSKLAALDGLRVDIEGVEYIVKPGYGNIPRQLIPYNPPDSDRVPAA